MMKESCKLFNTVEELIKFTREEREKAERYATRFILVDDLKQWSNLINKLKFEVNKVILLSQYCAREDVFPSLKDIMDVLETGSTDESMLILPLAEYLRLDWENAVDLINQIVEWSTFKTKRIYVPLFAAEEMLHRVLSNFGRYQQGLLPHVWKLKGYDMSKCELTIVPFSLPKIKDYVFIKGVKEYFALWEKEGYPRIWLMTYWAPYLSNSLQVYNFCMDIFPDAFSFISSWEEKINEKWGTKEQWNWLVENIDESKDFDTLCGQVLNMKSYDSKILFSRWDIYNHNERWLAWLWSKLREQKGSYLYEVLQKTDNVNDLIEQVSITIFSLSPSVDFCSERKELLQMLQVNSMPAEFWDLYENIDNALMKLKVLTDISERERECVVLCVGELLKSQRDETWSEYLRVVFPDLWRYLQKVVFEDPFITSYFHVYNQCRIKDEMDDRLKELMNSWTEEKFWSITPRHKILEEQRDDGAKVIWVDAMGVEWTGLLAYEIQEEAGVEVDVKIGRAVLPSITEVNREWKEMDEHVEHELDKIAHDSNYNFPTSFLKALSFIKKVARKVKEELNFYPKVVITSDHGLSRFALFTEEKEDLPEDFVAERGGRYATCKRVNVNYNQEGKFLIKDENIIWLNHNRFKGASIIGGEVHGGATPEECLVPIIVVSRGKREIKIKLLNEVVELNYRQEGWLIIEFDRPIINLELRVHGKTFVGERESNLRWRVLIKGLPERTYSAEIWGFAQKLGSITFDVKRKIGIEQNDLGL